VTARNYHWIELVDLHKQDRIPFEQQTNAMGHAVRANYLYAGAADLYAETGASSLWAPLERSCPAALWCSKAGFRFALPQTGSAAFIASTTGGLPVPSSCA
jgi:hypothetical protein